MAAVLTATLPSPRFPQILRCMAAFLFLPSRPKIPEVSQGDFICPQCRERTHYKHMEWVECRRFFFVITFLGDTLEQYVECQRCKGKFSVETLRGEIPADQSQILNELQARLRTGTAIEHIEQDLLKAGIDLVIVRRYVSVAVGISRKRCPQGHLSYHHSVIKCTKCGHVLPASKLL